MAAKITKNFRQPREGTGGNGTRTLDFGANSGLMGGNTSEYTVSLSRAICEIFANTKNPPKINIFDRERIPALGYSCIVVSLPNAAGEICYHASILEATGLNPLTAGKIVEAALDLIKNPRSNAMIYVPSDAINIKLNEMITPDLELEYPGARLISCGGLVVHDVEMPIEDLAMRIASTAYNSVYTESLLSTGELADLNLATAVENSGKDNRKRMRIELNMYNATVNSVMGVPTRQDFKATLVEVTTDDAYELNSGGRNVVVSVGGFVDAIRHDTAYHPHAGAEAITVSRLHPNIILTNNNGLSPTQGFAMLSTSTGTVMSRRELFIQTLASINPHGHNSPGNLNVITNIEGGNGGMKLDFSAKSVSIDEHYQALSKMFSYDPIISVDTEVYGPESYYTTMLSVAGGPSTSPNTIAARREIVESCVQLTNGHFPSDYNLNEIFSQEGIIVPMGHWNHKDGLRDLRDIDAAFVCGYTNDVQLIEKWLITSLPCSVTGFDPFLTRCEIINAIMPEAVIDGKACRNTYDNRFLATLVSSIKAAGVDADFETSVNITEQYDQNIFQNFIANSGFTSSDGFGRQTGGGSNGAYTAYSQMGEFRY